MRIFKVKEISFHYFKSRYYLKIYFESDFIITDITTNHPRLKNYRLRKMFPKTLYRILHSIHHPNVLELLYQLYKNLDSNTIVSLQLNSSLISGNANFEVIKSMSSYCLHLSNIKIDKSTMLLKEYHSMPRIRKETAYSIYKDIYNMSLKDPAKMSDLFEKHPYSNTILYAYFAKTIGTTPHTVWTDRRLIKSIFYLVSTNDSVKDIHSFCGFKSKNSYHKSFKRIFKISPIAFRKLHLDDFIKTKFKKPPF